MSLPYMLNIRNNMQLKGKLADQSVKEVFKTGTTNSTSIVSVFESRQVSTVLRLLASRSAILYPIKVCHVPDVSLLLIGPDKRQIEYALFIVPCQASCAHISLILSTIILLLSHNSLSLTDGWPL